MHLQKNIKTFAKEPDLLERISERAYREALHLPMEVTEEYAFLARGEYNENFVFTHPESRPFERKALFLGKYLDLRTSPSCHRLCDY